MSYRAFWQFAGTGQHSAAIDSRTGREWSYAELRAEVRRVQASLPRLGRKSLGLLLAQNQYECLVTYLAALNAGTSALILLDSTLNDALLGDFLNSYTPDWIFSSVRERGFGGYRKGDEAGIAVREEPRDMEIHPDLAILLTTSGSTGSPRLVRLTLNNLAANADCIARYLDLTPQDRPITSLPMSYSYGLSVINSHLRAGATIVLSEDSVLRKEFWDAVDGLGCTSFAGVPYMYQMLVRTGLLSRKGASLKVLTQAGGRLDERLTRQIHSLAEARGWKFFVMYGQTEATARISYVPADELVNKAGSVGVAIPDGSLSLDSDTGELIYRGPNVMMGYADGPQDLARGDDSKGVLRTGDLARQDSDGYFYITGRMKRFLKLFGKRFNLDEAESILSGRCSTPVACYGDDDLLIVSVEGCLDTDSILAMACETFDLPRMAVKVIGVRKLPRTPNGKLDYQRLIDGGQDCAPAMQH